MVEMKLSPLNKPKITEVSPAIKDILEPAFDILMMDPVNDNVSLLTWISPSLTCLFTKKMVNTSLMYVSSNQQITQAKINGSKGDYFE